jgi:hypothetical protein
MVDYFPSHPTRTMSREKLTILEDTLVRKLSEHLKVAPHSRCCFARAGCSLSVLESMTIASGCSAPCAHDAAGSAVVGHLRYPLHSRRKGAVSRMVEIGMAGRRFVPAPRADSRVGGRRTRPPKLRVAAPRQRTARSCFYGSLLQIVPFVVWYRPPSVGSHASVDPSLAIWVKSPPVSIGIVFQVLPPSRL